jgi:vacuolar iron transporter family protein
MSNQSSWNEEMQSAYLYRVIADKEAGLICEKLFRSLEQAAEKQAAIWEKRAAAKGLPIDTQYCPDLRTRLVAGLVRLLGPRHIRTILAAMKIRGLSIYSTAISTGVANTEVHSMPTSAASGAMERRHRGLASGGNLRAAVFGVNDGLVSNASLIMGVAGATMQAAQAGGARGVILLSGFAGMLAGAFSMAAGEYVSVRSQREMYEYQIALEREELAEYPEEEAAELALIYEARGVEKGEAERVAAAMIADPVNGLDTLAREELGLNPDELGSPWGAAAFSFFSFSVGAMIPLAPFLLMSGTTGLYASIALTATALFGVGSTLSLFTGRGALRGGIRMLLIGGGAGTLTFLIGKLLGVNLS